MAFFARPAFYNVPETSFTPLFRLLDDFDKYSQDSQCHGRRHHARQARTFNPKFDAVETESAYELHGELPGIERENLHIEFTEPQTVVIRGRVERSATTDTAPTPAAAVKDDAAVNKAALADAEWEAVNEKESTPSHQATVSDEETEASKEQGTPAEKPAEKKAEQKKPANKYWVSERSTGEFTRTFNFPNRVDQEGVTAILNNGILTVSVPKARKHEAQSITIN